MAKVWRKWENSFGKVGKKFCPVSCLSLVLLNWDSQQGKTFSLPSIRNFPISFKPKVAIAEFFWKMQRKIWYSILEVDAMPLSLKNLVLIMSSGQSCTLIGLNVQFKIQILNGLKPSFLRFRWLKWKSLSFLSSFCSIPEIVKSLMSSNKPLFSVKSQRSLYNWQGLTNLLAQKMPSFCVHRTIKIVKWRWLWPNGGLFTNFIGVQID